MQQKSWSNCCREQYKAAIEDVLCGTINASPEKKFIRAEKCREFPHQAREH